MKDRILKIHASPYKAVLTITGGGTEAIGELLRYGEGSNTLLEAVVPYSNASVDNFLHHKPEKYCAPETAQFMAMSALSRAKMLAPDGCEEKHLIGVGATCSLVKAGTERAGRRHHAYIAVATHDSLCAYYIELRVPRSREEEERFTAELIEEALAVACGLPEEVSVTRLAKLETYTLNDIAFSDKKIIFAGSFNPVHHRHLAMAEAAYLLFGSPVDLELSITNFDKPPLAQAVVAERIAKIKAATKGIGHINKVYVTHAATFVEKAALFGPATFVVGSDTLLRLAKHGDIDETVAKLTSLGAKFLVCERLGHDSKDIPTLLYMSPEQLRAMAALCHFASPKTYADDGTSSTKLRDEHG